MKIYNHTVFPSILTEVECDLYHYIRKDLINWIYDYQSKTEGIIHSNRGGWQSPSNFHHENSFEEYKNYILLNASKALSHYKCDFSLTNMWININKKNDYNVSHNHPNCIMSGVFWVKAPEKCGVLQFTSPNYFVEHNLLKCIDNKVASDINYCETFTFTPREGTIVLFPSQLFHNVESNNSEEDRISIAFNLNLKD